MPVSHLKDKKGNTVLFVAMVYGLTAIARGMRVCLTVEDDALKIQQRFTNHEPISLDYSNIKRIQELNEKEVVVKNASVSKSTDKHEVLVLQDSKSTTKSKNSSAKDYIIILYEASSTVFLVFEEVEGTTIGSNTFIEEVREKANLMDMEQVSAEQ